MLNAKFLVGSGAGAAGLWKLWPEQMNWVPVIVGAGILLAVWLSLVVTICAMDYRRRNGNAANRSTALSESGSNGQTDSIFPSLDQLPKLAHFSEIERPVTSELVS